MEGCSTCWAIEKIKTLLNEKDIISHHGRLALNVKEYYHSVKYMIAGKATAQQIHLTITNGKGEALINERNKPYHFPDRTPHPETFVCAYIDWDKICRSLIEPLNGKVQDRLLSEYHL